MNDGTTLSAGAPASTQATRHARRIYVGGLPATANEASTATFFSNALAAIGGVVQTAAAAGVEPVLNVYMNHEKKFAFVEFRTVEETSNAIALDGVVFDGVSLRVRRPNDYNAAIAATLGPSTPSTDLDLAAIGLVPGAGGAAGGAGAGGAAGGQNNLSPEDTANRLFVGGLPYFLTEPMVKELVEAFGPTKHFMLVMDRETGNSKVRSIQKFVFHPLSGFNI